MLEQVQQLALHCARLEASLERQHTGQRGDTRMWGCFVDCRSIVMKRVLTAGVS